MRTLKQYSQLVDDNKEIPSLLTTLNLEISADYGRTSAELIQIKQTKPKEWVEIKKSKMQETENGWEGKPLSDKLTEMIWRSQKFGKREVALKMRLKALEKYQSAIKTHLYALDQEAHNQY